MQPEQVAHFIGTWGYPAYVVAFLATAFGSPVTEDLLLLCGGYLISAGHFSWPVALPLSYACVLTTDSVLYSFGLLLRKHSVRRDAWLRRLVRPAQLRLATRWFSRFGERVVFIARLVPGTRLLVFITAGVRGMPFWRFLAIDGAAALFYVPLTLFVGTKVGERLGSVERGLAWVGERASWVLLTIVALMTLRALWHRWTRRALAENGR
jgi:membrane protein DedA with SNARE-associated domain